MNNRDKSRREGAERRRAKSTGHDLPIIPKWHLKRLRLSSFSHHASSFSGCWNNTLAMMFLWFVITQNEVYTEGLVAGVLPVKLLSHTHSQLVDSKQLVSLNCCSSCLRISYMDTGSPVLAELKTGAQHMPYIFPKYKCGLTCWLKPPCVKEECMWSKHVSKYGGWNSCLLALQHRLCWYHIIFPAQPKRAHSS